MRIIIIVLVATVCVSISLANEQIKKGSKKNTELSEEQLWHEKAMKAYQEDMAATERFRAQMKKSETANDENDNVDKNETSKNKTSEDEKSETKVKPDTEE